MKFLNHLARVVTNLKPVSTATYDRTPAPTNHITLGLDSHNQHLHYKAFDVLSGKGNSLGIIGDIPAWKLSIQAIIRQQAMDQKWQYIDVAENSHDNLPDLIELMDILPDLLELLVDRTRCAPLPADDKVIIDLGLISEYWGYLTPAYKGIMSNLFDLSAMSDAFIIYSAPSDDDIPFSFWSMTRDIVRLESLNEAKSAHTLVTGQLEQVFPQRTLTSLRCFDTVEPPSDFIWA